VREEARGGRRGAAMAEGESQIKIDRGGESDREGRAADKEEWEREREIKNNSSKWVPLQVVGIKWEI